jgi:putative flippase GtrA
MQALRRSVLRVWPRHRQKTRYLVVGAWNSVVAYGSFSVLYYILHEHLAPSVIVAIAYALASVNGYLAFRSFVFTPVRNPVVEYLRYQAVYLPILAFNLVALPLALTYTSLNAYVIQALIAVVGVAAAYVGNKYFAFRKPTERGRPD